MLKRIFSSDGVRQSVMTGVGNIVSACMSAVAMMIISRQLGPEKFGVFSVGFAMVLILSRFSDLGLTFALQQQVPKTSDKNAINRLFSFVIKTKIKVVMMFAVVGLLVSPLLSSRLNVPLWVVLLSFVLNVATVCFEQLAAMYQSLHRFRQAVYSNLIQSGTKMLTALGLYLMRTTSPLYFFTAYMGAPMMSLSAAKTFLPSWVQIKFDTKFITERKLVSTMAMHAAIGYMAAGLIENIDVILVQDMLSSYDTGLLAGANRIAMLFTMVAFSLAAVLNSRVSRYTDIDHLHAYLKKAWIVFGLCLVGFGLSSMFARPLIMMTIGSDYLAALPALLLLLASAFITIAVVPFIAVFFALPNMEAYFSIAGLLQVMLLIGLTLWLVPIYGYYGAALARMIMKLVLFIGTIITVYWGYLRYRSKVKLQVDNV